MSSTLLATKLYMPVARAKTVRRPRLIEELNTGASEKLTLISAPAGFGKSSLAREWVLELDKPIAWLSLDEGDNDLTRFFSYLIAALQQIEPSIGRTIQSLLGSPDPPPSQTLVTALINDIAISATPFVLVLDDYHAIQESLDSRDYAQSVGSPAIPDTPGHHHSRRSALPPGALARPGSDDRSSSKALALYGRRNSYLSE